MYIPIQPIDQYPFRLLCAVLYQYIDTTIRSEKDSSCRILNSEYVPKFQKKSFWRKFSRKPLQRSSKFWRILLKVFQCGHLKERKILNKMRGRSALHDLLLKTYRHQKTPMKCFSVDFWCFLGKLYYFFVISDGCKTMKSWVTPHLVQNFMLFQMATLKKLLAKFFRA